ncbi:hypothetical protein DFH09DRAFT_1358040 [Mycena vulgaris]|nr:hypothetical protein DFH09DRAFT_1358040 [Mycena vulgaris]
MSRPTSPLTAPSSVSCPHCLAPFNSSPALESSPIPRDILATNRPPLDPEILHIRRVVAAERARKTHLDAQIAALKASLERLAEARRVLETEIEEHDGTLSPLRRMPPELLSLVFAFARAADSEADPAPWTVSHVCRRWRAIAVSQTALWASVVLDIDRDRTTTPFRLENHLQRSGKLPLKISLVARQDQYSERDAGLLDVIVSYCSRWQVVRISGRPLLYSNLARIRGQIPILRDLNVTLNLYDEDEDQPMDIFELAPNLREATVNTRGWRAATIMLPFPQLQRYFASSSWDSHLDALRSASNLVECALQVHDTQAPPTTKIALPHLLRLSLSESNVLECLDTPNLQELYCSSHSDNLSSLLERWPYRLQKLVLFYPASITDLADILRASPALTALGLSISAADTDALSALLTLRNDPTDVGLDLNSITVCFQEARIHFYGFGQTDLVVDMVESRWRGGSGRLRAITIPDMHYSLRRDGRLERFKIEGLKVKVASRWDRYHLDIVPPHLRLKSRDL